MLFLNVTITKSLEHANMHVSYLNHVVFEPVRSSYMPILSGKQEYLISQNCHSKLILHEENNRKTYFDEECSTSSVK